MLKVEIEKQLGLFHLAAKFECPSKGIIALFGRSGAGKTSLVNMLAGLLNPDRGRILLDEATIFDSDRRIDLAPERRRLGYVFQEGRLFPHLSVRANLLYGWHRIAERERRVKLDDVVALLGLEKLLVRYPYRLSGGEKQRVAIGRALLASPRVLLLDEPLANIDETRKDEILNFIETLNRELQVPIIYVSHSMAEVMRLADTLVLMSDGRVAAVGGVEELTSRLDLRPLTGRYEAGAVLRSRVLHHLPADDLSAISYGTAELLVPHLLLEPGTSLRVRVRARDVALALHPPVNASFLNILSAEVQGIGQEDAALTDVLLNVGGQPMWARVTRRSRQALGLSPGLRLYALIKSVAIDRHSLGRWARGGDRFMENEAGL